MSAARGPFAITLIGPDARAVIDWYGNIVVTFSTTIPAETAHAVCALLNERDNEPAKASRDFNAAAAEWLAAEQSATKGIAK